MLKRIIENSIQILQEFEQPTKLLFVSLRF